MHQSGQLETTAAVQLQPGEVISYRTCGGGGFGAPTERDPELVLKDARESKVSVERAREIYRVVVDAESWTVDKAGTAKLRNR